MIERYLRERGDATIKTDQGSQRALQSADRYATRILAATLAGRR
jgi:hypothetical protein